MSILFNAESKTDCSISNNRETTYNFLNRSGWAISDFLRITLERFAINYAPDQDFLGAFKAKSHQQHNSAIFELLIYVTLNNSSLNLTKHPETATGKRPDFKVQVENFSFFLECTLSAASFETMEETNRMNRVIEIVDAVYNFPYWINLHFEIISQESISKKQFLKFIKKIKIVCDEFSDKKCIETTCCAFRIN